MSNVKMFPQIRYKAVELKRSVKGYCAVIIDTQHPSGVPDVEVQFCKTLEDAKQLIGD